MPMVASTLEAEWNERLRALTDAQDQYEQQRGIDQKIVDEKCKELVRSLASGFPVIWNDPQTSHRDRKRMVQLLIEDVTLIKGQQITCHIRFKGGACETRTVPLRASGCKGWKTDAKIVQLIDKLLDEHTDEQIARILNDEAYKSGKGVSFTPASVRYVRTSYRLKTRYTRLQELGLLTQEEIAECLDVAVATIRRWRRLGLLKAHAYDNKNRYLYEPVAPGGILKHPGIRRMDPRGSQALSLKK